MVFLAIFSFNFHSVIPIITKYTCYMYSSCKIWKEPIDKASFFACFFHNIGPNLTQIVPLKPHPLSFFFAEFQWNMLGDSIKINNFCCNPVVLKKIVKPLKNCFLGAQCTKGSAWTTACYFDNKFNDFRSNVS